MSVAAKFWEKAKAHPIWSKVIAALITAAILGVIGAFMSGGWPAVFSALKSGWAWFWWGRVSVPGWLIVLLSILAALAAAGIAVLIFLLIRIPRTASDAQSGVPFPADFTEAEYFTIRWRWSYDRLGKICDLATFCPICDLQIRPSVCGFRPPFRVKFSCEECKVDLYESDGPLEDLEDRVTRKIQQELRQKERREQTRRA